MMDLPQIISCEDAAIGDMGQRYLITGKHVALRRWHEQSGKISKPIEREYETVGYLLKGKLELDLGGQTGTVEAGDSWLIPAGAKHQYRVIEPIIAIEATSPPARFNERDSPAPDEAT